MNLTRKIMRIRKTLSELARCFELHPNQISIWKRKFLKTKKKRQIISWTNCIKRSVNWKSKMIFFAEHIQRKYQGIDNKKTKDL